MASFLRQLVRRYYRKYKSDGLRETIKLFLIRSQSYLIHTLGKSPLMTAGYREVDFETLSTDSDCVFILGSGSSVNDITDNEWALIEEHADTIGFNHFYKGEFVDIDYHVVREMSYHAMNVFDRLSYIAEYMEGIDENPCYDETLFFVNATHPVIDSMLALELLDLFAGKQVTTYSNSHAKLPQESTNEIAHLRSTLFDAINFSYLIGYETVVLVGVDLYDRRYFWYEGDELRQNDEYRDADIDSEHNTTSTVLEYMPRWRNYLDEEGVVVHVENERSLLHTEGNVPAFDITAELG